MGRKDDDIAMTERLKEESPLLLLDGPTGTELERHGFPTNQALWSARALIDAPHLLGRIHVEYMDAGADVITVNSFRTNRRAVVAAGLDGEMAELLTRRAVHVARRARETCGRPDILIAGSDAPADDCYTPDAVPDDETLMREHAEHCRWLAEEGADLILIETMNTLREARIACAAAMGCGLPVMVSLVTDALGDHLLDGTPLSEAVDALARLGPAAILTNCSSPRASVRATEIIAGLHRELKGKWLFGGYPNGGEPDAVLGYRKVRTVPLDEFVEAIMRMRALGATVVGSCCGTTPETTRALSGALRRS